MIRRLFILTAAAICGLAGCSSGEKVITKEEKYPNGRIKSRVEYHIRNGEEVLWGKATYYYESGAVELNVEHANGKRHGTYESFYENGEPRESGAFAYGNRDGTWTEWDKDGKETKRFYEAGVEKKP